MSAQNTDLITAPITLEQFLKNIQNKVLACVECSCGYRIFIPTPICPKCKKNRADNSIWRLIKEEGIIRTYCVTYVGPPELADLGVYVSLIVDFGNGLNISALLNQKIDPHKPPLDLINKKVIPSFIERPDGHILLGMTLL